MAGPKVVIIGAGSLFFGRQAIWQMVTSEHLNTGTLALVDTEPTHLARMTELARKAIDHAGVSLKLDSSGDRCELLAGADFVVLSFAYKSVKHRALDCEIAAKFGIRMCSGDTIGPGGIMRTLREFPNILACCKDIEELCPDAWVINYINPAATHAIGLQLYAPNLKSFAMCDGLHMPHVKRAYAGRAGITESETAELTPEQDRDFDMRITGPNHFTFLLKAEYQGEDLQPRIAESLRQQAATETDGGDTGAKALNNDAITYELYKALGYLPACTGHTKEYVRYWQGNTVVDDPIPPIAIWDHVPRYEWHWDMWNEVDGYNYGTRSLDEFIANTKADHATDVIEAMWGGLDKPFHLILPVGDAVPNMNDACMEILCDLSMDKITPRHVGDAPVGLRGLWRQVLDSHELTARAAAEVDRDLLYRAFATDPLCQSLADSQAMIEELLAAEKDVIHEDEPAVSARSAG